MVQDLEKPDDEPFPLTDTDRWVLSQTDEEFHLHTWDELVDLIDLVLTYRKLSGQGFQGSPDFGDQQIGSVNIAERILAVNKLEVFKRKPSDLRRYMAWSAEIKIQYGSMLNYLLKHRLPWGSSPPFEYISSVPFQEPSDYKILLNDWPYGITPNITHIVVWSKTPIATDNLTGDVTDESRRIIEDFVSRVFIQRLNGQKERVAWFKNWVQLQSVRALEHVHILVRDANKDDIEYWVGN